MGNAKLNSFNTFSSAQKIAKEWLEKDKINTINEFVLANLILAYRYREEGCAPWDERDLSSKRYAYDNLEFFENLFKLRLNFYQEPTPGATYYSRAIDMRPFKEAGLSDWIIDFEREHPTIRQSYIRGMVNALRNELQLPDDAGFPMI